MTTQKSLNRRLPSSFRDSAGFLFRQGGVLYRQVNYAGIDDYRQLMDSGLYQVLTEKGWLIEHEEADIERFSLNGETVLRPREIPFVSYPYEWCFSQLKAAALLTLDVAATALAHGMILRDASAYNVQFIGVRPVFIDTLSFGRYESGPWMAYRQFCQHFLAPLALMARRDARLLGLLQRHIDGIPLDLAARLLPWSSRLSPLQLINIHLHARMQSRHAGDAAEVASPSSRRAASLGSKQLAAIIDGLRRGIVRIEWRPGRTTWSNYYKETNYSDESLDAKARLMEKFLHKIPGDLSLIQDLGANTGRFSRIAAMRAYTLACDMDVAAVEANYRSLIENGDEPAEEVLPLVLDLTNPSPSLGWAGIERTAFFARDHADLVLALALIHHLAISNNVPLEQIAELFATAGRWLIVEFVPKEDSQVQRLLASREDIFHEYDLEGFERAFNGRFDIKASQPIPGTQRSLYLMAAR